MNQAFSHIIHHQQRSWYNSILKVLIVTGFIIVSSYYAGLFDPDRMLEGIPSIISLIIEGIPPDFSNALT